MNDWQPLTSLEPLTHVILGNNDGWGFGMYDSLTDTFLRMKYHGGYEELDFKPTRWMKGPSNIELNYGSTE